MHVCAIKSKPFLVGDSLIDVLNEVIEALPESSILAITSKVVSLAEGRVVPKSSVPNKYALVKQEADAYLPEDNNPWNVHLTIKDGTMIASAGIDESNAGEDVYILYPEDTQESAFRLWDYLRARFKLKNVGVLITDSHVTPLRRGVTGVGLGWCGFSPIYDYVGKPDVFGHPLRVTKTNVLDALAASAVFLMGEGNEQTPFAVLTDLPKTVKFSPFRPSRDEEASIFIDMEDDIYSSLLGRGAWIWNE